MMEDLILGVLGVGFTVVSISFPFLLRRFSVLRELEVKIGYLVDEIERLREVVDDLRLKVAKYNGRFEG